MEEKKISAVADKIIELGNTLKAEADKFDGGNNAAGARVRKTAQEARLILGDLRKDVTATIHERKGK